MADRDTVIATHGLTRDFPSVRALDRLSIEVSRGTVYGFLGPNGAGKTTTLHLLLGLLEPSAGRSIVLGFDPRTHGDEVRARTGALLEDPGLYDQLSAEDNLEFYARVWHLPADERRQRIKELLDQMELWPRRHERVAEWSRGMRQKLAVARALLHRPSLLLLDEPTAGLDVLSANALRNDLSTLVDEERVTVFLTTHNMVEAEQLCHRIAVIRDGHLVAVGDPGKLQQAGSPTVLIRGRNWCPQAIVEARECSGVVDADFDSANGCLTVEIDESTDVAEIVGQLVSSGISIDEVVREKASLEQVFLRLMEEER